MSRSRIVGVVFAVCLLGMIVIDEPCLAQTDPLSSPNDQKVSNTKYGKDVIKTLGDEIQDVNKLEQRNATAISGLDARFTEIEARFNKLEDILSGGTSSPLKVRGGAITFRSRKAFCLTQEETPASD